MLPALRAKAYSLSHSPALTLLESSPWPVTFFSFCCNPDPSPPDMQSLCQTAMPVNRSGLSILSVSQAMSYLAEVGRQCLTQYLAFSGCSTYTYLVNKQNKNINLCYTVISHSIWHCIKSHVLLSLKCNILYKLIPPTSVSGLGSNPASAPPSL